ARRDRFSAGRVQRVEVPGADELGRRFLPHMRGVLRRPFAAFLLELFCATSLSSLRARFTESLSGKARATSGSSRTRFVPAIARWKYLPRTAPFMVATSYSGRRSPLRCFIDAFFILFLLPAACPPRADDSNAIFSRHVRHDENSPSRGQADRDLSIF